MGPRGTREQGCWHITPRSAWCHTPSEQAAAGFSPVGAAPGQALQRACSASRHACGLMRRRMRPALLPAMSMGRTQCLVPLAA